MAKNMQMLDTYLSGINLHVIVTKYIYISNLWVWTLNQKKNIKIKYNQNKWMALKTTYFQERNGKGLSKSWKYQ